MSDFKKSKADKPLLMIPGPTEFDSDVLAAMGEPTASHVAPDFIEKFGASIELVREGFLTKTGQPFIVAGSGTLGWDMIVASLCEAGDSALVVNTGYFSDSFGVCLEAYSVEVDHVRAPVGDVVSLEEVEKAVSAKSYKLVALTQVDTSTGVLNDIKGIASIVRRVSPNTLIAVDGVCSFLGEEFRFDDWDIDAAMTGSQKALGVPPGLMVLVASQRAMGVLKERKTKVPSYFANMNNWLPIMKAYEERRPSYFATPAVNLICALYVSLKKLVASGVENVFKEHLVGSLAFKAGIAAMGLDLVPVRKEIAANTLSAVRYPSGITGADLLPKIKARGVIVAGGLHKDIKTEYFRVGHMGISTGLATGHIRMALVAIQEALKECGHKFAEDAGTKAFDAYVSSS